MQVHRPRPDGAAAGQRHLGVPRPRQQRPQHVERGPHLTHQVIGGEGRAQLGRVEQGLLAVGAVALGHLDAELAQQLAQEPRVGQARHIGQQQGLIGQDRRGHQLDGRILRPADRDGAVEAVAAVDDDAVHESLGEVLGGPGPYGPTNRLSSKPDGARDRSESDGRMTFSCSVRENARARGAGPCAVADWRAGRRPGGRRARPWRQRRRSTSPARGASSSGGRRRRAGYPWPPADRVQRF
ncbi:hypothetical protein D3C73_665110 [compost metagenome]